ncbi:hypothetical protein Hdeb2414_s0019g00546671 [Helianthus debilis subsp. tardiflorus]
MWIRRWYFLYISVFIMLPNFRKTCHEKFSVLQDLFGPNINFKQLTNALNPIIHDEASFLTSYFCLSNTYVILILTFCLLHEPRSQSRLFKRSNPNLPPCF